MANLYYAEIIQYNFLHFSASERGIEQMSLEYIIDVYGSLQYIFYKNKRRKNMGYYGYYNPRSSIDTILLVCFILSFITAIVLLAAFLPKSKQHRYSGFTKSLYNFFNFQSFWISPIIKLLYMTMAFTLVLSGFIILFIEPLVGLGFLIVGVIIRLFFETGYILYAILDQLTILNRKFGPAPGPAIPLCPNCKKQISGTDSFCNNCGAKLLNQ